MPALYSTFGNAVAIWCIHCLAVQYRFVAARATGFLLVNDGAVAELSEGVQLHQLENGAELGNVGTG